MIVNQIIIKNMRHYLPPILLILIVSLALYSNSLKNGFVYDDEDTVVNNIIIKDLSKLSILFDKKGYFDNSGESSYRPVCTFTYFIDYAFYELNPWGYHLTNIVLHAVNGILLFAFLTLSGKDREFMPRSAAAPPLQSNRHDIPYALSLLITFLFVTHPVLTEAVNAISYREDLLVFMFYLTTMILYLLVKTNIPHSNLIYSASCLSYFLALLSKEMAVTLPLTIYCYEWVLKNKDKGLRVIIYNRYNIGYIAITLIYVYIRFYLFQNPVNERLPPWSSSIRLITIPWLTLKYIAVMMAPFSLSADYKVNPVTTPFSPMFILSLTAVAFCVGVLFKIRKSEGWIAFGMAFFLITLLPVSNFIPIGNPLAERYLYLPAAGFTVVFGRLFYLIGSYNKRNLYILVPYLILICLYSIGTINRNKVWKDSYSLWYDTVKKMPDSQQAHYNLGLVYYGQGRLDEAMKEYLTVLEYNPNNIMAHNNLGNVYDRKGWLDEAIKEYLAVLKYNPSDTIAHYNLGRAYYKQGRSDEAIKEYLKALILDPNYVRAHYGLGVIYHSQGQIDKAIKAYLSVLRIKPNDLMAHYKIGVEYSLQNQLDDAMNEFRIVLELDPNNLIARNELAYIYMKKGLFGAAATEFETILKARPDFIPAREAIKSLKKQE